MCNCKEGLHVVNLMPPALALAVVQCLSFKTSSCPARYDHHIRSVAGKTTTLCTLQPSLWHAPMRLRAAVQKNRGRPITFERDLLPR